MRKVRGKDTTPEMKVRSALHRAGYRFRLHRRDLPGRPDIVLPGRRAVVFVHGCFWHRHPGCRAASSPSTRREFWQDKFERNVDRDRRNVEALAADGWSVHVVWECETKGRRPAFWQDLANFLGGPPAE
jgi:DNA mismatch endonuclease (patch repair protein)